MTHVTTDPGLREPRPMNVSATPGLDGATRRLPVHPVDALLLSSEEKWTPPHLHVVADHQAIDLDGAARAVSDLLIALGQDPDSEHLVDTPRRVAAAYAELLSPEPFALTTFANDEGYDELVVARDIPVHSLCEHHLLPFRGVAHVGYLPGDRILGISKLARVVDLFARRLQVQERLTKQVADWLEENLASKGVGVVIEPEHLRMKPTLKL